MTASRPEFHELTFVAEHGEVTVGRPDTESYVTLPADGAELLRRMIGGMDAAEAAGWYRAEYGEAVDIEDFLATLDECGFVRADGAAPAARRAPVRWQRLGRRLFSPPAWLLFSAVTAAGVLAMVREPQSRPHPHAIFLADSLLLTQLVLLLGQIPGLLWHESFHVLAARRLGIGSRMTIGRRMYFLVLETHLDGLLGVPSRRRYLPFAAGVVADTLLFCALTAAAAADAAGGGMGPAGRVALAFAFPTLFRIAWQFFFFLRTDLYYMVSSVLGCTDLHEAAVGRLRRQASRLLPRVRPPAAAEDSWSPRDRAVARWYAPAMAAGVALLIGWAGLAIIPALVEFGRRMATGLSGGGAGFRFWDSAGSATVIVAQFALPFLLPSGKNAHREERRMTDPAQPTATAEPASPTATASVDLPTATAGADPGEPGPTADPSEPRPAAGATEPAPPSAAAPHIWLSGPDRSARASAAAALPGGRLTAVACHRRLRGPYTGAGNLLRTIVPAVPAAGAGLISRHAIEILSVAPELRDVVDTPPQTLTSLASPEERTRYYSPLRTRRIAHGITEFLNSWAEQAKAAGGGRQTLFFDDLDAADPTDQEFLTILLRRARPEVLRLVVGTGEAAELPAEPTAALERYASRTQLPPAAPESDPRDGLDLLRAFVASDGTSDNPAERAAHQAADPSARAELHRARALELEESEKDEHGTLRLGAIPYHRSLAGPPTDDEGRALMKAADHCLRMGYYEATVELGRQGRAAFDPRTQERLFLVASGKTAQALGALGRTDEAEVIYREQRVRFIDPVVHMVSSYALSMLYTRSHPKELQDVKVAREYVNNAIAIASQLPDPEERAFHTVFQQNGLALIELREGNLEEALRLVTEGMARLDAELGPDARALHRSVLLHNRAQVNAGLGRLDDALADFDAVIAVDPCFPEYHCDRAALHLRRGDAAAALADYDRAAALTPPIHELYYNRADARRAAGDPDGALTDLRYVLDLEPDYLAARVNLVSLLTDAGEIAEAAELLAEGMLLHPGDADLLCARGLIAMEQGESQAARADFDAALAADPLRSAVLANRAVLHFEAGRFAEATGDLDRALDITGDDPDLLFNRAFVHQHAGDWAAARADYLRADALPGADHEEIAAGLAVCEAAADPVAATG